MPLAGVLAGKAVALAEQVSNPHPILVASPNPHLVLIIITSSSSSRSPNPHPILTSSCQQVDKGIQKHGIINHEGAEILAYEVDGWGNAYVMDDANLPSLRLSTSNLSLSLVVCRLSPSLCATRGRIWVLPQLTYVVWRGM